MNDLVSIVVPFYNAEKFLDKCISSIVKQTYSNYELILVNNNSNDESYSIAKKYSDNPKVKLINCTMQGVSYSRNMGINEACGKWLLFVDADDYLESNMLEDMMRSISDASYHIQCIEVGFFDEDSEGKVINSNYNNGKEKYFTKNEILADLFESTVEHYQGYLWNKLLLLDVIKSNKILFDTNIYYNEDRLFLTKYFINTSEDMKVYYLPNAYYHYVQHENSAMGKIKTQAVSKVITEIKAFEQMQSLLNEKKYDLVSEKLTNAVLGSFLILLSNISFEGANEEKEYVRNYINQLKVKGLKQKLKLLICKNKILLKLYKFAKGN